MAIMSRMIPHPHPTKPGAQKTPRPIDQLDSITQHQVSRARLVCATNAADAADLAQLLDALAIGPDWPERWRGPVAQEAL